MSIPLWVWNPEEALGSLQRCPPPQGGGVVISDALSPQSKLPGCSLPFTAMRAGSFQDAAVKIHMVLKALGCLLCGPMTRYTVSASVYLKGAQNVKEPQRGWGRGMPLPLTAMVVGPMWAYPSTRMGTEVINECAHLLETSDIPFLVCFEFPQLKELLLLHLLK